MRHLDKMIFLMTVTFLKPSFSEEIFSSPDSLNSHFYRISTTRFYSDLPSQIPGMWERDFGSMNAGPWYRYRGSDLNELGIAIDGIILREPLNHQIDMNLLPWGDADLISLSTPINSTVQALQLTSQSSSVKKPVSRIIYQNILFRPNTISNQTYFDMSYRQSIRSNLNFSFGVASNKYANDFPDSVLSDKQVRGHVQWDPFSNLSVSYGFFDNNLSHNLIHPMRFSGDTLSTASGHLNQERTDHLLSALYHWKNLETRLSYAYSRHAFILTDRYDPYSETTHVYSNGIDLRQSLLFNEMDFQWGLYHTDDRADFFNPGLSLDEQGNLLYLHFSSPLYNSLLMSTDLKKYSNSVDQSAFLYNLGLSADLSDKLSCLVGLRKNLRSATFGERSGRTLTPYPSDQVAETYAILNHQVIHPNAAVKGETSHTIETGLSFQSRWLTCETMVYMKNCSDVIRINTNNPDSLFYDNIEEIKTSGIEGRATLSLPFDLQLSSVCNYFKGQDRGKNDLLEPPDLWGSFSLSWGGVFFQNDLDALFSLTWQMNSQYYLSEIIDDEIGLISVDNDHFLNAKADLLFMQRARFSLAFENILNQQLTLINYPLPLRTFRMGIEWKLLN